MFRTLLIANRGEIACRIARTARVLGMKVVAVYSDADVHAAHVEAADIAVRVGPEPARESYLRGDIIIAAARETCADAIHPGYGFLSENAQFAEACAAAGIAFVGPPPSAIRTMGLKDRAKALMQSAGVPVVPGYHGADQSEVLLEKEAIRIGYPVLIKAAAGGGGKGMRLVETPDQFAEALASARREASSSFGDDRVLIEKYVTKPRHIEVQVFADRHGSVVHLFERDCSVQRRHQKVVEEAPAPGMTEEMRAHIGAIAVKAARAVSYEGAGTIEFIADASEGLRPDRIWFMEMNTRLQVEHPVTEAITGLDLVAWQLRVASGEPLPLRQDEVPLLGHAVEARLYAENPHQSFLPSSGLLERFRMASDVRVDSGFREGDMVTPFYDPMIAKVIAHGDSRADALARLADALEAAQIAGPRTNNAFLIRILRHPAFDRGVVDTHFIARHFEDLVPHQAIPDAVLTAAAACLAPRPSTGERDPWGRADSFRLAGEAKRMVEFVVEGRRIPVELPPSAPQDLATIRLHNGDIAVMDRGETYVLRPHDPLGDAEAEASNADAVASPMPGKVVQVFVKSGDIVRRGQPLVVVEAMKMEHTLASPRDGIVEVVSAQAGQQVSEGAVLVRLGEVA